MAKNAGPVFTEQQLKELVAAGKIRGYKITGGGKALNIPAGPPPPKREGVQNYGNVKAEYNGIIFDSIKERARYIELEFLIKIGEIRELRRQVAYELNEGGTHSLRYTADFVYLKTVKGKEVEVVEDAKGFRTRAYKKARRLMKKVHGIEIHET